MSDSENWVVVCGSDDLVANSGVCALVNEQQVALFKIGSANDDKIYAIHNWDPIGKANVLYRGLVGSVQDKTVVSSPLFKQRFCLSSGECVDDITYKVRVYPARVVDQQVQLQIAG